MKTIGQKIAEKRKQMHLTQEELAFKLNVSPQAVSKWENDLSIPDVTLLIALSDLFNISLDELIREKQNLPVTTLVEQENKKPLEKMLLKIIVNSKDGDKVKVGDTLVEFDMNAIKNEGYELITPVIITNTMEYLEIVPKDIKSVNTGETLITIL